MYRAILLVLLIAATATAQAPKILTEAAHCSVEKQMLPDGTKFPLRIGYSVDKKSFQVPEIFVVFLPLHTKSSGFVIGLSPDHVGGQTKYYINNNAGFAIHSPAVDFTPDAPLGGLATQAAITRGIRSAISGTLYTVSRRQLEEKISNLRCIGLDDPQYK
jgi:hypothetical protein